MSRFSSSVRTRYSLMAIDLPLLQALRSIGIACPYCGNEVLRRGTCPLWFPRPDCLTDDGALALKKEWKWRNKSWSWW